MLSSDSRASRQVKAVLKTMLTKTDRRDADAIVRLLIWVGSARFTFKSVPVQKVPAVLSAPKTAEQGFIALEIALRGGWTPNGWSLGRRTNRSAEFQAI